MNERDHIKIKRMHSQIKTEDQFISKIEESIQKKKTKTDGCIIF